MGGLRKLPPETHDRSCPEVAKISAAVGGTVGRVYGLDRIQAHHHKKEGLTNDYSTANRKIRRIEAWHLLGSIFLDRGDRFKGYEKYGDRHF